MRCFSNWCEPTLVRNVKNEVSMTSPEMRYSITNKLTVYNLRCGSIWVSKQACARWQGTSGWCGAILMHHGSCGSQTTRALMMVSEVSSIIRRSGKRLKAGVLGDQ